MSVESRATELFTSALDQNFVCSICLNVMGNPYDTPCHHTYCFDCINTAIKANGLCPECRQSVTIKRLHPSPFKFKSVLHNQITVCDSETEGKKCEWSGAWSNLDSHLKNDCVFVKTLCTFGCGKEILRCNLQEHESNQCPNRNTPCRFCKEEVHKLSMEKHFETCLEAIIKCKCKAKFPRKALADHALACQETVLRCLFSWAGCTVECERKHLAEHLQTWEEKHTALLNKKLADDEKVNRDLNETVRQSTETVNKSKEEIQSLQDNLSKTEQESKKFGEEASMLKNLNTTLAKQLKEVTESHKKTVADLKETKTQVEQAEKEVQKHLQEKELLGKQNEDLETALSKSREELKLSQSRNSEVKSELEAALQQLQQESKKERDEHEKLSRIYQQNKESFDKQNSDSMVALMAKGKELKDVQWANKLLQSEIQTLKMKNESQLNELKKKLESTTQANETKMKSTLEELSNLQEKNFNLLLSKTNLLAEQKQEREFLENQKSDLQTMLSEMEQELERMRSLSLVSQPQEEPTRAQYTRFNLTYLLGVSLLLWIYIAIKV